MNEEEKRHYHRPGAKLPAEQFAPAASLAGLRHTSRTYLAARNVLVMGESLTSAGRRYGITKQAVAQAVERVRDVLLKGGVCPLCLSQTQPLSSH